MKKPKKRRAKTALTPLPQAIEIKSNGMPLDERVYTLVALQKEFCRRGYQPYTRSRIWQLEQISAFPARVKLGQEKYSRIGWLKTEIDAWFRSKLASRPENRWRPTSERNAPALERTLMP